MIRAEPKLEPEAVSDQVTSFKLHGVYGLLGTLFQGKAQSDGRGKKEESLNHSVL